MNRFKLVVFLVAISMILAACGPAATEAPAAPAATEAPATEAPTEAPVADEGCAPNCEYADLVVGFLQTGSEGGWRAANTASFKETAEQLGLTLKFYDSQNDLAKQVAGFQQFIEDDEVNVIVMSPLEVTGWDQVLEDAQAAGKIVILSDRRIDGNEDKYVTFIGADFVEEGRKAGTEMCKLLEGSESKNVWELQGNVGAAPAIDRGTGFRETAEECGIVVTKTQTANWSVSEGKQVTEAWLKETKDVQGIFGQNDEMAFGAIEALKEAGLVPAEDVKIISVDATAGAFQAMLDGTLNVTVECNPLLAPQVYEAALAAMNGETLPKWIPSEESVFFMDDPNLQAVADGRKY
ncbi:MAG: ABC transporter substrate-binding protein [Anaerolineales bacterium]|nr:ABC transporter substrate-binding protein [Anaerolineales bacterium]